MTYGDERYSVLRCDRWPEFVGRVGSLQGYLGPNGERLDLELEARAGDEGIWSASFLPEEVELIEKPATPTLGQPKLL